MEDAQARSSLSGILLQTARLSVLMVQNRVHLYKFLLLKITVFNQWVTGLAQKARGSRSRQVPLPPGTVACSVRQAVHTGLALLEIPVWLVLWVPRLVWASMLGCAQALGLSSQCLAAWAQLGPSSATWMDLFLSCLHSLMLVALLLLLLAWRLCQVAHRFSLGQLSRKALLGSFLVLQPLMWLRRLYCWVVSTVSLLSWHLVYLVTWTTCLASHLLQAAFEHTSQLAQEVELQEASWTLWKSSEAGPALREGLGDSAEGSQSMSEARECGGALACRRKTSGGRWGGRGRGPSPGEVISVWTSQPQGLARPEPESLSRPQASGAGSRLLSLAVGINFVNQKGEVVVQAAGIQDDDISTSPLWGLAPAHASRDLPMDEAWLQDKAKPDSLSLTLSPFEELPALAPGRPLASSGFEDSF
ncbi:PREDICTED: Williams-Beuren syndrome chromosomal region 28 protein [Elephantulus edwardii]|uniref:Williams-Beuren syndrome chromosomal region 28 protein n=1 Tax=Elephantulus edwardii TaxID=28737 RepID=UPI0003F07D93|nr:PREDICTED: Williams-Beuren syndrome chromosomal region 28 protein [Elephantulus edwardii]